MILCFYIAMECADHQELRTPVLSPLSVDQTEHSSLNIAANVNPTSVAHLEPAIWNVIPNAASFEMPT